MKGGPFALISADRTWPYGLSSFSSFYCKKSGPIRVRLQSDEKEEKKTVTVIVGLFSLEMRRLKKVTVRVGNFSLKGKSAD